MLALGGGASKRVPLEAVVDRVLLEGATKRIPLELIPFDGIIGKVLFDEAFVVTPFEVTIDVVVAVVCESEAGVMNRIAFDGAVERMPLEAKVD